ncbi:MAG: hypothetical protein ABIY51_15535 [Ferruginibacter sp.]
MNTDNNFRSTNPFVEQRITNATSWIGTYPGLSNNIAKGQTFLAPAEADVETIEIYSSLVTDPGEVVLTLHSFDPENKSWGPSIGSSSVQFTSTDAGRWVAFNLPRLRLAKGKSYGFKLQSSDSFIGVGEAAGSHQQPPFSSGQEWKFSGNNSNADSFSYFSLAFKVGLRA